jgi:hypothetical protein
MYLPIKKPATLKNDPAGKVGMTGFEPATSSSRTTRATGLRYIPKNYISEPPSGLEPLTHALRMRCSTN